MKSPVIQIYQAPASEPVSLDEVKTYLRIDGSSEDDLINSMITAARCAAEKYTCLSIITQKWKILFNDYVPSEVFLPYGPVTAIDSVKTYDATETSTTFPASNYYLTAGNTSIFFDAQPSDRRIEIIYSTGFAATPTTVPALLKQGILAHIAFMYERKISVVDINETAKPFYNFYRNVRI